HPPAGRGRRPALDPGAPRPRLPLHHPALHGGGCGGPAGRLFEGAPERVDAAGYGRAAGVVCVEPGGGAAAAPLSPIGHGTCDRTHAADSAVALAAAPSWAKNGQMWTMPGQMRIVTSTSAKPARSASWIESLISTSSEPTWISIGGRPERLAKIGEASGACGSSPPSR